MKGREITGKENRWAEVGSDVLTVTLAQDREKKSEQSASLTRAWQFRCGKNERTETAEGTEIRNCENSRHIKTNCFSFISRT